MCFATQRFGHALRSRDIRDQQEALIWVFKPQKRSRAIINQRFISIWQLAEKSFQRRAGLKTGDAKQHIFVVCNDCHFRENRILFQFSQLRISQATAFDNGKTVLTTEQTQIAPHLSFRIAMRHQQMLMLA
ncbi:hypothetical protein D3C78_1363570 [compost metagenome]